MWCSSNHFRTPMCASPIAPPPSRATPILGRGRGEGFCCASEGSGSRRNRKFKTMRRMGSLLSGPSKSRNSQVFNEFGSAWRFQQERMEVSGAFLFLQDIAAIHNQDLSGDVGSFRRSEETNRGGDFIRRAGAAERRV